MRVWLKPFRLETQENERNEWVNIGWRLERLNTTTALDEWFFSTLQIIVELTFCRYILTIEWENEGTHIIPRRLVFNSREAYLNWKLIKLIYSIMSGILYIQIQKSIKNFNVPYPDTMTRMSAKWHSDPIYRIR